MGVSRIVALLATTMAAGAASFQAAAAPDAARCAETRRYITQLEDNLRRGPPASDRRAFEQSLSVYRKAEVEFCGGSASSSGVPGGGGAGGAAVNRAAEAAAQLGLLTHGLQSLGQAMARHDAAPPPVPLSTLPAPPVPTGNVNGPLTMQRLGGTAPRVPTSTISVPQPHVNMPEPTVNEPRVRVPTPQVAVATPRQPTTPEVRQPTVRAIQEAPPSPFPTDGQIGLQCATASNPSMCELSLQNKRNTDPAYRRWQAENSARMDRNIDAAMANVDTAIVASRQTNARSNLHGDPGENAQGNPRIVIPTLPPPIPYDNSDPDLAKCREGEIAPWTIAGCYDLGGSPPRRDTTAEQRAVQQWRADAEQRLAEAIRNGRQIVPEDRDARATCRGTWMYDGLSAGACTPSPYPMVYAVTVPDQ